MTRQTSIERLHELLKTAVAEGIIEAWAVEGPDVVFIHKGEPNPVPALEAAAFLESLFGQRRFSRGELLEKGER